MAKIEIPEVFREKLGPTVAMDLHIVNVWLKDGRKLKKLAVRNGTYITGYADAPNGESELDFSSDDIIKLRTAKWWPLF